MGPVDWSSDEDRFMDDRTDLAQECIMWDISDTDVEDDNTMDGFEVCMTCRRTTITWSPSWASRSRQ